MNKYCKKLIGPRFGLPTAMQRNSMIMKEQFSVNIWETNQHNKISSLVKQHHKKVIHNQPISTRLPMDLNDIENHKHFAVDISSPSILINNNNFGWQ